MRGLTTLLAAALAIIFPAFQPVIVLQSVQVPAQVAIPEKCSDAAEESAMALPFIPELADTDKDVKSEPVRYLMEYEDTYSVDILKNSGKTLEWHGLFDRELMVKLEGILQSYDNEVSIAIYNQDGTKTLSYNTERKFVGGSTVKFPYCMYICKLMDEGLCDCNEKLTYLEWDYSDGSGIIQYDELGTEYTINELIHLCISISDNVAYKMLFHRFGCEEYNEYIASLGCESLVLTRGQWIRELNSDDFVRVWQTAYEYFAQNTEGSILLKNACTNSESSYVHKGIKDANYSHKSGYQDNEFPAFNDAGIMWKGENTYFYSVFTNSIGEDSDRDMVTRAFAVIDNLMNS